jgi:tetratricopeptide (TPR) repeat protein
MKSHLRLSLVIAALMASLFAADRVLATLEQSEIQREASIRYQTGMRLLHQSDKRAALATLQRAHVLVRDRREYTLGLSEALIANNMRDAAEAHLRDLLAEDSNDGRANLLLARLLASESKVDDATAYYHRAIYGVWHGDTAAEIWQVRMELARYLAKVHRPQELLSELLLLQDRAEKDPALAREVAGLYLIAGSSARAAQMYRDLLRKTPNDAQAYRDLGEAELLEGDYRAAESMFLSALHHNPADPTLQQRLRFASTLAKLDPTPRRLTSGEKYHRATRLLASIRCADAPIETKPPGPITNELAEAQLSLAEQLWEQRGQLCPGKPPSDEATALIMQKLKETH